MRYFLDIDESSHWHVVEAGKRSEWEEWCNLDPDNEDAWETPDYAKRINGAPNWVTFENWLQE